MPPVETDYVDGTMDGWAREWPRLRTSPLQITARLDRLARLLERRMGEALAASGITGRDLDVLGALRRAGSPFGLPASQLAKAAMLTSGGMTGQADRLANAGLVVRRPDPDDRRAVLVTLTPEGRGVTEEALKTYLLAAEEVLAPLDENERTMLAELLRKLLVALEPQPQGAGDEPEGTEGPPPTGGRRRTTLAGPRQEGGRPAGRPRGRRFEEET